MMAFFYGLLFENKSNVFEVYIKKNLGKLSEVKNYIKTVFFLTFYLSMYETSYETAYDAGKFGTST